MRLDHASEPGAEMKVLQVVIAPNTGSDRGISVTGPERRAANLVRRWPEYGIEPIVCYPRRGNLWNVFEASGVPLVDFEIGNKLNWSAASQLALTAKRHGAQVIHTQGPPSLDLFAFFASRSSRCPLIITRPMMIEDQVYYARWRRFMYGVVDSSITLRFASRVVAVSRRGHAYLRDHLGVPDSRLRMIHNGVLIGRFDSRTHSQSNGDMEAPPVVLGMIAQLFPPKGWFDFIAVVERLHREGLNVRGLIVGEGELRHTLEELVRERGLKGVVEFSGFHENVAPLLSAMDVLLFTSHQEGLSVAIIESMASGLPVVATDVGGIREQVTEGVNGHIVKTGDIETMARWCTQLIRDPALRAAMGNESRKVADLHFNEDRMLREYADCYHALLHDGVR